MKKKNLSTLVGTSLLTLGATMLGGGLYLVTTTKGGTDFSLTEGAKIFAGMYLASFSWLPVVFGCREFKKRGYYSELEQYSESETYPEEL